MLVWALDDVTRIDEVKVFHEIEIVERDLDTGSWVIAIPWTGDGGLASRWVNAPLPGIEVADPDTDFRFGGFMTSFRVEHEGKRSTAYLEGRDFQSLLADRLAWPDPTNLSRWWDHPTETKALTTAVYDLVYNNAHLGAFAHRRIPHLEFGPDFGSGGSITYSIEGDPLIEMIRTWLTGTPFTCRLRFKREMTAAWEDFGLVFECGARPTTELVLTPQRNVGKWTVERRAAETTWVVAMGATWKDGVDAERAAQGLAEEDPDPPVKFMTEASNPLVNQTWMARYVEAFINRSSSDVAALASEAAGEVRAQSETLALQVDDVDVTEVGYGRDLHIGWLVPVQPLSNDLSTAATPGWQTLPVAEFRWSRTAEAESRTISLGSKPKSPTDGLFKGVRESLERVKRIARRVDRYL